MTEFETESLYGMTVFRENPFLQDVIPKTRTRRDKATGHLFTVVNTDTGESAAVGQFWTTRTVEDEQFIKWYFEGMRTHAKLNSSGLKVFELLFKAVQSNAGKDNVDLSFRLMTDAQRRGISYKTYTRGVAELKEKGFIAQMPATGRFWINPNFMFNGDRLQFITEYKRTKSATEIQKPSTTPPTLTQRPVDPNQTDIEDLTQ